MGMPLGAGGRPSLPERGARRRQEAGPCQLAAGATAGGSGTVINKIIIRNKPQALAERLHCHAGTAYPALGSLARQTWGCSQSPNHTCPGNEWAHAHGQGEAVGTWPGPRGGQQPPRVRKSPCKPCLGDLCDSCRQGANPQADGASITAAMAAPSAHHDNICSQEVAALRATTLRLQTAPSLTGYKYGRRKNQHSLLVLRQS